MPDYAFVTQWWFDAPIERVWEAIRDSDRWPSCSGIRFRLVVERRSGRGPLAGRRAGRHRRSNRAEAPRGGSIRDPSSASVANATWWRSVVSVERVASGDAAGVGEVHRFKWHGRLPYTLAFDMRVTRMEPPTAMEGVATGELEGTGFWRLAPESGGTAVRYDWNVQTTTLGMRLLAPIGQKSCGFREVGRRERFGKMGGRWRDVILLERRSRTTGVD